MPLFENLGKKVSSLAQDAVDSSKKLAQATAAKSKNVFFFHSSLMEYDFNDLEVGDKVEYTVETKEDGKLVAKDVKVIE